MKEPKDIFDLFKDNEDKLNQPPSSRAWERLENRLDNHRSQQEHRIGRRRPSPWRNMLSMTGVLLVLVTMISAISLLLKNQSVAKTAMNESAASPMFVLEEIGTYSDQIKTPHNIGLYEKQLQRLNTNPFLEGDPSKELRVQRAVYADNKSKFNKSDNNTLTNNKTELLASASSLFGKWVSDNFNKETESKTESVKNNLTIEFMKVESRNGSDHVILKLSKEESLRSYELKSAGKNRFIFENEQLSFPGQVILQTSSSESVITATFNSSSRDASQSVTKSMKKILD